jgi:hypothetical protein
MRGCGLFSWIGLVLVALSWRLAGARADCDVPEFALLWSYPADGATDVPTNTQLWFLTSQWGIEPRVRFQGERLRLERAGIASAHRAEPGPLLPNHRYELEVAPPAHDESSARYAIAFTTAAGPATAPDAPDVRGFEWSNKDASGCPEIVGSQDCFDTGQDAYVRLKLVELPGTIAWLVAGGSSTLWPLRCGYPTLFVHGPLSQQRCFKVRALGAGGLRSEEMDTCMNGPADEEGGGCALAPAARGTGATTAWLVIGLLTWRLCVRTRRPLRRSPPSSQRVPRSRAWLAPEPS